MSSQPSLFDPAEHEPLTESTWDETRVRSAIDRIVETTHDAYEPGRFWPRSPLDDYRLPVERDRSLWIGAAGVLWALDRLGAGQEKAASTRATSQSPTHPAQPD